MGNSGGSSDGVKAERLCKDCGGEQSASNFVNPMKGTRWPMESVEGVWNSRDSSIREDRAWLVVGAQLLLKE